MTGVDARARPSRSVLLPVVVVLAVLLVVLTACAGPRGAGSSGGGTGATNASGDVVWRAGSTRDTVLDAFRVTPWNTDDAEDPRAVDSPDVGGRAALAFTVPGGGTRSELEPGFRSFREGDRFFFGLGIYLPADFPTETSDWQLVAQWKNGGDGSPPLSVKVQRGRFVLDGGAGIDESWQRDIGPAPAGRRTDLVVGVRFSSDPDEASVDVWRDGDAAVSGYHPRGGTLYPDEVSYLKVGLYRSSDIDQDGTVYYDDVTIARTREAASSLAGAT